MSSHSRRSFLQHAAAALSVGACYGITGAKPDLTVAREVTAERFKYAMCNEAFENWPQEKVFRFIADCGYGGVEIAPFTINKDVTQVSASQRKQLRNSAEAAKIEIVGLHWLLAKTTGLHLTSADPKVRAATTTYLIELARFCHDLGGAVMVFGSPQQRNLTDGVTRAAGLQYAVDVLRPAMQAFAKLDVVLALEPLSPRATNFMTTAAEAIELAEMVDSPHCRLLLDCKAMSTEPTPIPELIHKHRDWLVHFHANDTNLRGPGMGDLDFLPILRALQDGNFGGWVSVEVFDFAPGPEALARESIDYLRNVAARLGDA